MAKEKKGRRVKCYATGEYGTDLTFVKIGDHYYKDKETFEKYTRNNHYRTLTYEVLSDFLGYQKGQIFPGVVHRRLKKLEFYGFECIYQTIVVNRSSIEWALRTKDFKNDISALAYIFAIIDNNINDVYKKMRSQNKKTALPESTDYAKSVNLADIGTSKKGRDISEFLEA